MQAQVSEPAPPTPHQVFHELNSLASADGAAQQALADLAVSAFRELADSSVATDHAEALERSETVLQRIRAAYGEQSSLYVDVLRDIARLYLNAGDLNLALATSRRALAASERILGPNDPANRFLLQDIAAAERLAGDLRAATLTEEKIRKMELLAIPSVVSGGTLGGPVGTPAAQYQIVPVYFKTTRAGAGKPDPYRHFQNRRVDQDTFGISYVSVPRQRAVGTLPHPSVFRLDLRADPGRHVIVKEIVKSADQAAFYQSLRDDFQLAQRKELLIYVHGFNQSFIDGVETAAGLAVDLELDGRVISFSWPSKDNVLRYSADTEEVLSLRNQQALMELIRDAAARAGAARVYLVAHSLGNRLLLEALKLMPPAAKPVFDSIVFASPDVESSDFAALAKRAAPLARRMTLYAVDNDMALATSAALKASIFGRDDYIRAGNIKANVASTDTLDVIDATTANVTWLGHNAFAFLAKDDLRGLLWFGLRARERCLLVAQPTRWAYAPNTPCTSEAFQMASIYRRRSGDLASAQATIANEAGDVSTLARGILQAWSSPGK